MIQTPYLLFLGDAPDMLSAKVAIGIRDWRPEHALGQIRMPGCGADLGIKDMTLAEAKEAGARTLVIGVANRGGYISQAWKEVLIEALEMGYDLASGLHNLLRDEGDLVAAAQTHGCTLHDVRVPTVAYPIANGKNRTFVRMSCDSGSKDVATTKKLKNGGTEVVICQSRIMAQALAGLEQARATIAQNSKMQSDVREGVL